MKNTILILAMCASPMFAGSPSSQPKSALVLVEHQEEINALRQRGSNDSLTKNPYERTLEDRIKDFEKKEANRIPFCPNKKCAQASYCLSIPLLGFVMGGPKGCIAFSLLFCP